MDITNGDVAATQQHHDATKRSDHDSSSNQNQSIHDDDVSVSSIIALRDPARQLAGIPKRQNSLL
eukprot:scaffold24411_cov73-Skeletonema_marinoi.AAC.1